MSQPYLPYLPALTQRQAAFERSELQDDSASNQDARIQEQAIAIIENVNSEPVYFLKHSKTLHSCAAPINCWTDEKRDGKLLSLRLRMKLLLLLLQINPVGRITL